MAELSPRSPQEALKDAVEAAGSQSAFAVICSVSQTSVWKWLRQEKPLPAERVLRVEAATGVSRHLLRPDIYPLPEVPAGRTVGTGAPVVACDRSAEMKRSARA